MVLRVTRPNIMDFFYQSVGNGLGQELALFAPAWKSLICRCSLGTCVCQSWICSNAHATPAFSQYCCDTLRPIALTPIAHQQSHKQQFISGEVRISHVPTARLSEIFQTPSITATPILPMVRIACSLLKSKKVECRSIDLPPAALHSAVHGSQQSGSA